MEMIAIKGGKVNDRVIEKYCRSLYRQLKCHARQPDGVSMRFGCQQDSDMLMVLTFRDTDLDVDGATFEIYLDFGSNRGRDVLVESSGLSGGPGIFFDEICDNYRSRVCSWLGKVLMRPRVLNIYRGFTGAEIYVVKYLGTGTEGDIVLSTQLNIIERLVKLRVASIELPSICITDPTEDLMRAYDIAVRCNERSRRL